MDFCRQPGEDPRRVYVTDHTAPPLITFFSVGYARVGTPFCAYEEKKVTEEGSRVWCISLERQVACVRSCSRSDPVE